MKLNHRKINLRHLPSNVRLDDEGKISVTIHQISGGQPVLGNRVLAKEAQQPTRAKPSDVASCKVLIRKLVSNELMVMSQHPGLSACEKKLRASSKSGALIGLRGMTAGKTRQNLTYIATNSRLYKQPKCSLASEDIHSRVFAGKLINFYGEDRSGQSETIDEQTAVRWAVLNCHDYTDVRILARLLEQHIEVLVIVTHNPATRLYWEYAKSDVHRMFCYVVIVNVAEYGGSAVFAPFRRLGEKRLASFSAGGQIFGARGPGELTCTVDLDVAELRRLRRELRAEGFCAPSIGTSNESFYTPMVPSQHYMSTFDVCAEPPAVEDIDHLKLKKELVKPRIAVAQLNQMDDDLYVKHRYRLRRAKGREDFENSLMKDLKDLERRCKEQGKASSGNFLDFLVLPEVFLPRDFVPKLKKFSDRLGCTIVAGVDYPGTQESPDSMNANECVILAPHSKVKYYRKITRSQYDAIKDRKLNRMPMQRGSRLIRMIDNNGRGIGILICYDYSHLNLISAINLEDRNAPLDVLFVVSHNPFGELYKSMCIADSHRFYQYLVMCNVSQYGGSGVFAPTREYGASQVLLEMGKNVGAISLVDLDVDALEAARASSDEKLNSGKFMRRPGIFQFDC